MDNLETSYGDRLYSELEKMVDEEVRNPKMIRIAKETLSQVDALVQKEKFSEAVMVLWNFLKFLENQWIKFPYTIVEDYTSQMMALLNENFSSQHTDSE